jgi:hypothetical protein
MSEDGKNGLPKHAAALNKSENAKVGVLCFCVDWIVVGEDSYNVSAGYDAVQCC